MKNGRDGVKVRKQDGMPMGNSMSNQHKKMSTSSDFYETW